MNLRDTTQSTVPPSPTPLHVHFSNIYWIPTVARHCAKLNLLSRKQRKHRPYLQGAPNLVRGRRTSEGNYYDVSAPSAMIRLEAEHRMQNARMQECHYIRSVCVCVCTRASVHAHCTCSLGKTYWKMWHYNNIQIEIRRMNLHFRKPGQCVHAKGQREPLVEDFASGLGWGHTLLMPGWGSCVGALVSKLDCW